jgi:glycosyltransferase involved in cell wall biosynthesis
VQFHGYVSDSELQRLYAEAHLFLMPAVQGYGIPAIEALQRGLPVLLHRDSGVSDILLDTPWATVIHGDERGMLPGLQKAIGAVVAGVQLQAPVPCLPTEDEWAERVARLCGWV